MLFAMLFMLMLADALSRNDSATVIARLLHIACGGCCWLAAHF
jgi:hypothetical protein